MDESIRNGRRMNKFVEAPWTLGRTLSKCALAWAALLALLLVRGLV